MTLLLLLILLIAPLDVAADPWGKDADLAHYRAGTTSPPPPSPSPLATVGGYMIRFHQEVISPADGPRSHFIPSSSQYTLEAMHKYGFFYGYLMGCDRLMRENDDPWIYQKVMGPAGLIKWNPVP